MEKGKNKIGVTIVTGYLGAGKTTLINYILKNSGNKLIAVIENEFGEINIDNYLVAENIKSKELLIALDKGCVCCSLREDLVSALAKLFKKSEEEGFEFSSVLLETTGLADPGPVAFTFFANRWVQKHFYLDAIVTVVDVKHTVMHLNEDRGVKTVNEAVQQIAFADIIFLNKIDLLMDGDEEGVDCKSRLDDVREQVRNLNSQAKFYEVQLNKPENLPPLSDILGLKAFSMDKVLQVDPNFFDDEDEEGEGVDNDNDCSKQSSDPSTTEPVRKGLLASKLQSQNQEFADQPPSSSKEHLQPKKRRKTLHDLSGVATVGITARGHLDKYRFDMFMKDLLTEKGTDIFRSKGVVAIKDHANAKFVFQGVHETFRYGRAHV
eukprot:TRINITY_DN47707_c0_g2_i3.p1 TRINITY_DN47707_c0_g2~~TRINITY_DN47707_c0_g2_i3.p1  ORF type:complete len:379 (+),score=56.61 TRINITY_DN47707_c0_g2_i3:89-1225(+)